MTHTDPIAYHITLYISILCLVLWGTFALIKLVLPTLIQKAVRDLPLDKDLKFHLLHIYKFKSDGQLASIDFEILHSKPWIPLNLRIQPNGPLMISLKDSKNGIAPLLKVVVNESIHLKKRQNLHVKLDSVDLQIINVPLLSDLVKLSALGGETEMDKLEFNLEFKATFDFWNGFLVIPALSLEKEIHLGTVKQAKKEAREKRMEVQEQEDILNSLIPHPTFSALPANPTLTSIVSGFLIEFSAFPTLEFNLPLIKAKVALNGSQVASCTIYGLVLEKTKSYVELSIETVPLVVSKPIRGALSAARGVVRGALTGTLNGLLFGQWGEGSTIMGVYEIEIYDFEHSRIEWLETILNNLEIEKDLDAVKRVKTKAGEVAHNVKDGLSQLASGVVHTAISRGSKCILM